MKHLTTKTVHFLKVTFYGLVLAAVSFACSADTFTTAVEYADIFAPTVKFVKNVQSGPVQSNEVSITVSDANLDASSVQYALTTSSACDGSTVGFKTFDKEIAVGKKFSASGDAYSYTFNTEEFNTKYICVVAKDLSGRTTFERSKHAINIDITPPMLAFSKDVLAGPITSDTVTATIDEVNLDSAKYGFVSTAAECSVNSSVSTNYTSGAVVTFNDETHTGKFFCLVVVDKAGNKKSIVSAHAVNIDITKPAIIVNDDVLKGPVESDTVKITVTDTNLDVAKVKSALISEILSCTDTVPSLAEFTSPFEETYNTESNNGKYICIVAEDKAGNKHAFKSSHPINIDITPPEIVFSNDVDFGPTASDTVQIKVTDANEVPTSYKYALVPSNTQPDCKAKYQENPALYNMGYTSGSPLATYTDNTHNGNWICARAEDSLAHVSYKVSANKINIDTEFPNILFSDDVHEGPVQSDTVKIAVSSNTNTLITASYQYALVSSVADCKSGLTFPPSNTYTSGANLPIFNTEANNDKYICAKATNASGTSYTASGFPLNIDKTAPTITFSGPSGVWKQSDMVTITITDSPKANANLVSSSYKFTMVANASECKAGVSGLVKPVVSGEAISFLDETNNDKYVCAYAKDKAGNETYITSSEKIQVDIVPPAIVFSDIVDVGPVKIDTVIATITDANLDALKVKFALISAVIACNDTAPGLAVYPSGTTLTYNNESTNDKYVCIVAEDKAGNKNALKSVDPINIDVTPPTIAFSGPSANWVIADNVTMTVNDSPKAGTNLDTTAYKYTTVQNSAQCVAAAFSSVPNSFISGTPINFTTEAANAKYVCAYAKDKAGNETYMASANTFHIDVTPPLISFATGSGGDPVDIGPVQSDTVKVIISDNTLAANSVKYALIDASAVCNDMVPSLAPYASGTSITYDTEANNGKHVCVVAADTLGHKSAVRSAHPLNIDITKPKAMLANLPLTPFDGGLALDVKIKNTDQPDSNGFARNDVVAYKYKQGLTTATNCFVDAGYSAEIPIATAITDDVSTNKEKMRTLCAIAKDSAGNWQDVSAATFFTWTVSDSLHVYVEQGASQADPINTLPIVFDVTFIYPVNPATFTKEDIAWVGSATVSDWNIVDSGDHRHFTLTATNSSYGILQPTLPAGRVDKASDATKKNMASLSADNKVTYTKVQPTVKISLSLGVKNPTNNISNPPGNSTFKVEFHLAMDTSTLEASDFTNGGTIEGVTYTLTNDTLHFPITHPDRDRFFTLTAHTTANTPADGGTIIPKIAAGKAFSKAGNPNKASVYMDDSLTYDNQPPTAILTGAPPATPNINIPQLNVSVGGDGVDMYIHTIVSGSACPSIGYGVPKSATDDWITDSFSSYASGTYTLCVKGIDKAGNIQEVSTKATFTLDKTLPMAEAISGLPTGTSSVTTVSIGVQVRDDSGVLGGAQYAYKIIDGNSGACSNIAGYQPALTQSGGVIPSATSGTPTTVLINAGIAGHVDGQITLCLLGKRISPSNLWQTLPSVTSYSWVKNTAVPKITSAETLDLDGNGKLDHYRLTFDIKVKDSTFPGYISATAEGAVTTAWQIGPNPTAYTGERIDPKVAGDIANDNVVYLKFNEKTEGCGIVAGAVITQTGCDTGIKPDITSATPGLQSIGGTSMLPISTTTVTEKDRAKPVMVVAHAYSHLTLTAAFSEEIGQDAECGLGSNRPSIECSELYDVQDLSGTAGVLTLEKGVMSNASYKDNKVIFKTSTQIANMDYQLVTQAGAGKVKDMSNNTIDTNKAPFKGSEPKLVLLSAKAINNTTVKAVFNEAPTGGQTNAANYTILGLPVTAAVVSTDVGTSGETILLTTSSQLSETPNGYKLTVNGVSSSSGTIASPNNIAYFTGDKLPSVLAASSINSTTIYVTFSKNMNFETDPSKPEYAKSALNAGNYCIQANDKIGGCNQLGGVTATSVSANSVVKLVHTTAQANDTLYYVTVNNVKDINGNSLNATENYATFTGNEGLKILFAKSVQSSTADMSIFKVSFSKPYMCTATPDGGVNKCNDTSAGANDANNFKNWGFPFKNPEDGKYSTISLCKAIDDVACPDSYVKQTDNVLFFKLAHNPTMGAFAVVGATAAGQAIVATPGDEPETPPVLKPTAGCIKDAWNTGCLLGQPYDRATLNWILPTDVNDGPVYDDPFNDGVTKIGQVVKYNGKLLIGPNSVNSGLFSTDYSLSNAQNILLDSEITKPGIQPFQGFVESGNNPYPGYCFGGSCEKLKGIDYMYAACYGVTQDKTTLSGAACTAAGGTEYLFIVGLIDTASNSSYAQGMGYQSVWITKDKVSPFRFEHLTGLSSYGTLTYRAMNVYLYNGHVFQAQQHQYGGHAPRASSYSFSNGTWKCFPNSTGNTQGACDLNWPVIPRIGVGLDGVPNNNKTNGQRRSAIVDPNDGNRRQGLVSIDSMFAYKASGTDHLYMANGGSCSAESLTKRWRDYTNVPAGALPGLYGVDGGIMRSTNPNSADGWEDVTPGANLGSRVSAGEGTSAGIWNSFMSKALPQNANNSTSDGDWQYLAPANKISPSIKAIPKMVEFNGDLYVIRNACANAEVKRLSGSTKDTCLNGQERPQLWRLPKGCTTATDCASKWQFIGDTTNADPAIKYTTRMGGAEWKDGTDQAIKTAGNRFITILEKVGDRLYVGFDNGIGINLWRTKTGIIAPTKESDFEAICQTGNACFNPAKQFGMADINVTDTKFFDSVAVNDAGKDYIIINARNGNDVLRIYRQSNE